MRVRVVCAAAAVLCAACPPAQAGCPDQGAVDAYVADFVAARPSKGFGSSLTLVRSVRAQSS
jgi:hypothetical protein